MCMPTAPCNQQARSAKGITNNMQTSAFFIRKGNVVNMGKEK
jgi:hypothetical protein